MSRQAAVVIVVDSLVFIVIIFVSILVLKPGEILLPIITMFSFAGFFFGLLYGLKRFAPNG